MSELDIAELEAAARVFMVCTFSVFHSFAFTSMWSRSID